MTFFVGCCGFPEKQSSYFAHFPVVEVQQTFYHPPREATAAGWRLRSPADFVFTLKAWQLITHPVGSPTYRRLRQGLSEEKKAECGFFQPTPMVRTAWERTRALAKALEGAVILFQCPASFTPTTEHIDHLTRFFTKIDRGPFQLAWEPRGNWPRETVTQLCKRLDLIHCIDPFQHPVPEEENVYLRLHGIGGYRYRYTDGDLRQLRAWCRARRGFVLFNNISMKEDALRFLQLLEGMEP